MMKYFFFLFAVVVPLNVFAQYSPIKLFYSEGGTDSDSINCSFYTILSSSSEPMNDTLKTYYCKNQKLRSIVFFRDKRMEGYYQFYHPNGMLAEKTFYEKGRAFGVSSFYYANGKEKEKREYSKIELNTQGPYRYLLVAAWDSLGNQTVKNYNGFFRNGFEEGKIKNGYRDSVWNSYNLKGERIIIEKYDMGKFLEGERFSSTGTVHYDKIEVSASPRKGMEGLYKEIASKLKYPREARRYGIEGKVYVKFVIEPDGRITNVKTIKGVVKVLDEEAVRVVQGLSNWNPGSQRGVPIRETYTLPIIFKLK